MDKKTLFFADNIYASGNEVSVKNLSFKIIDGVINQVVCKENDFICSLITGDILPVSGGILFSGTNIANKTANERRISEIKSNNSNGNTLNLLKKELSTDYSALNYYELKEKEIEKEILLLKNKPNININTKDLQEKIQKSKLELKAISKKRKIREAELETYLKSVNSLILNLANDKNIDKKTDYIQKLELKRFSIEYQYSLFIHKKMSDSLITAHCKRIINQLSLPDKLDNRNIISQIAFAYVKMPQMMIYRGVLNEQIIETFNNFIISTGITIVCVSQNRCDLIDNIIYLPDSIYCYPK